MYGELTCVHYYIIVYRYQMSSDPKGHEGRGAVCIRGNIYT